MPGIVGLITKIPRASAEPQLLNMLKVHLPRNLLQHRNWMDDSLGVYVGWTALKGSFSDGMPLRNGREDVS